ncbi:MAG: TraB/GumN family protein [Burkholderiales bacterium]|jgi:hypothetical protein|nr:TraB/GumN family protein [Burkholderiales bacterium]
MTGPSHGPSGGESLAPACPLTRSALARGAGALCAAAAILLGAPTAHAADRFAQGLLFRVSKAGVPASYVFGVIHVADARVLDLAPPVLRALEATHFFAPELGSVVAVVGPDLEDAESLPVGQSLGSLVGEPAFREIEAQLLGQGVARGAIARMKPWAAMLRVSRVGAPGQGATLDEKLLSIAEARRMHILPLESIEEQIAAFDSIPMDTQVALLRHVAANREALASDSDATVEAWLRRDLAEIACVGERPGVRDPAIAPHYRVLCRHIIANRTVLLHYRLALPMRSGRVFVAIGASHIGGEAGLLRLLEEDGYTVTRVW